MNKKKSKIATEKREVQTKIVCPICQKEQKPVIVIINSKKKKRFTCNCGVFKNRTVTVQK
jgi:hypothetical protein